MIAAAGGCGGAIFSGHQRIAAGPDLWFEE